MVYPKTSAATSSSCAHDDEHSQLAWPSTTATVAEPQLLFSIRCLPASYATKVPVTGRSWNLGAVNGSQLGSWIIFGNGAQISHTGTNSPEGTGQAYRDIEPLPLVPALKLRIHTS